MVRSVLGVVVGVVVWMVGFWVLAILLAELWPDYGHHVFLVGGDGSAEAGIDASDRTVTRIAASR
jgi:hypothetical protein